MAIFDSLNLDPQLMEPAKSPTTDMTPKPTRIVPSDAFISTAYPDVNGMSGRR